MQEGHIGTELSYQRKEPKDSQPAFTSFSAASAMQFSSCLYPSHMGDRIANIENIRLVIKES